MPFRRLTVPTLAAALTLGLTPAAHAGPILQPASASTDMGTALNTAPNNARDQSGLSISYTSLVTDFDAYLASNPTHNPGTGGNIWASSNTTAGNFDYALGGTFTIESFALWNFGDNLPNNLRGFTLLADDNAAFSSPVTLGIFDANPNTGPVSAVLAQVFTFAPTSASFVRLNITSSNGGSTGVIIGEGAFEVFSPAAVPEPGTLALVLLALLGLAGLGARRRRSAA